MFLSNVSIGASETTIFKTTAEHVFRDDELRTILPSSPCAPFSPVSPGVPGVPGLPVRPSLPGSPRSPYKQK